MASTLQGSRHTCMNCHRLKDQLIDYEERIKLLEIEVSDLSKEVYQLRCLNEEYMATITVVEKSCDYQTAGHMADVLEQLEIYKQELRRYEKLLRQQQLIFQTKLISKEEEIKLLQVRIENVRLNRETQSYQSSCASSPLRQKEAFVSGYGDVNHYGLKRGTFNKSYRISRQSMEKLIG